MFELTGCSRNRKQVSGHLQFLKSLAHQMGDSSHSRKRTVNGSENSCQDFCPDKRDIISPRTQGLERISGSSLMNQPSDRVSLTVQNVPKKVPASQLYAWPQMIFNQDFKSLIRVSRNVRVQIFRFVHFSLVLNSYNDTNDLLRLCDIIETGTLMHISTIHVIFVGGDSIESPSSNSPDPSADFGQIVTERFPNLKTLTVTLIPRFLDPRKYSYAEMRLILDQSMRWVASAQDVKWGPRTKLFLASLGNMKALVHITLRWKFDCDYFEKEYVKKKGWVLIEGYDVGSLRP